MGTAQGGLIFLWTGGPAVTPVTPDKWMMRWDLPSRRTLRLPGGTPFVPRTATVDNTTNTVWPLTFGEKARPDPRAASQGSHLFVPKEATSDNTVTPDYWMRPFDAPPRYLLPLPGGQPFIPEEATVENTVIVTWPLTVGVKARPVPRTAPPGMWAYGFVEIISGNLTTTLEWQQPLSQAVPIPRVAPLGGSPFVPKEATLENTTVRVWPLTQGLKARPVTRPAKPGTWVFGYPYESADNTVTPDKWLLRWKGPRRSVPAQLGGLRLTPLNYRVPISYAQTVTCDITVEFSRLVTFSCKAQQTDMWGEETQESDPWSTASEESEAWDDEDENPQSGCP